jgi:hypothetical protein
VEQEQNRPLTHALGEGNRTWCGLNWLAEKDFVVTEFPALVSCEACLLTLSPAVGEGEERTEEMTLAELLDGLLTAAAEPDFEVESSCRDEIIRRFEKQSGGAAALRADGLALALDDLAYVRGQLRGPIDQLEIGAVLRALTAVEAHVRGAAASAVKGEQQ